MNKCITVFATICMSILMFSCASSIPVMEVEHTPAVEASYAEAGTLIVEVFEDQRGPAERGDAEPMLGRKEGTIWSAQSEPPIPEYFRSAIVDEIERTGLFRSDDSGEYKLSGTIKTLRVTRIKPVSFFLFLPFSHIEMKGTVAFHAVLQREGSVIWEGDISVVEEDRYSVWKEKSQAWMSERAATVLDKAVTRAIDQMLQEISQRV